jgi:hypothetical protein
MRHFAPVYRTYELEWGDDYPVEADLAEWAVAAGWGQVETAADPTVTIPLADETAFRTWLAVGARGRATRDWSAERREEFVRDLMAVAPRDAAGGFALPFGALYLTARNAETVSRD